MGVKNMVDKKKKAQVEEENESESESELEFEYNDADEDDDDDDEESSEEENDSDDPESEDSDDSETAEPVTRRTIVRKKRKNSKMSRFDGSSAESSSDASDEEDADNEEIDDDPTSEKPKKKKRKKMSKLDKATDASDDSEDDAENGEEKEASGDDDDESEGEEESVYETEGESKGEESEGEEVKAHKGFADALSNILGKKTVSTKKVILALGKTDKEIKKLKESKLPPEEQESKEPYLTPQELEEKRLKRKLWLEMNKVKPNALERNRERELKMIGTRGVVQLFNAVKKQQKMVTESLTDAHSIRKKDMVIESMNKKSFINLLQNNKVDTSMGTAEKETPMAKEPERKIWSVLKDDFVIGTGKMKDWDKQDDMEDL